MIMVGNNNNNVNESCTLDDSNININSQHKASTSISSSSDDTTTNNNNNNNTPSLKKALEKKKVGNSTSKSKPTAAAINIKHNNNNITITPQSNDVLSGRGGRINSHPGNIQYRKLVSTYKHTYANPQTKKVDKSKIASRIVEQIREIGGRFLKEEEIVVEEDEGGADGNSIDDDGGCGDDCSKGSSDTKKRKQRQKCWVEIGDDRARHKVGQALRESAPEIRSSFITKTASSLSSSSSSLLSSSTSSLVDDMGLPEIIAKVTAASPERRNKGIMGGFMGRRRALPMKKRKSVNLSSSDTSSVQDMEASDRRILELASKNAKRMSECELGVHNAINNSINNVNNSIRVQGQEKLLPQLNDVLIQGKNKSSSSTGTTSFFFNHIGNRRLRVLVEANLTNYFNELTSYEQWISWGASASLEGSGTMRTKNQCSVVQSIIESSPTLGRFLIQTHDDDRNDDDNSSSSSEEKEEGSKQSPLYPATSEVNDVVDNNFFRGMTWRLATQDEIINKVHSTFVAAGRYHVKQNVALMMMLEEQEEEEEELEMSQQQQQKSIMVQHSLEGNEEDDNVVTKKAASKDTPPSSSSPMAALVGAMQTMQEAASMSSFHVTNSTQDQGWNSKMKKRKRSSLSNLVHPACSYRPSSHDSRENGVVLPMTISEPHAKLSLLNNNFQPTRDKSIEECYAPTATRRRFAGNNTSLLDTYTLTCPSKIKIFRFLPMKRFFLEDNGMQPNPNAYLVPSNYDVLCGAGRIDFFHHIGNRRFRVMIEMNIQRYEQAYISSFSNNGVGGEQCVQKLIDEILVSLSKCDPPGRFLGMDMTNGTWNLLNPVFASLKTETTFFECLQVKQRRQARLLEEELEEEWERRVQIEKEELIKKVAALSNTRTVDLGSQPSQSITNRSTLSDNCPTGACDSATAIRNCLPLVAADEGIDVPSLQTQARMSLQKGKQPSAQSAAPATKTTTNNMAMSDITRKFAQEQSDASRALLKQLQDSAQGIAKDMSQRRSSLPIFSDDQQRVSFVSTESQSVDQGADTSHNLPSGLLDVVGGLMMMSRRGSL